MSLLTATSTAFLASLCNQSNPSPPISACFRGKIANSHCYSGGLVSHKQFNGLRGILSGPAGGVVGHARTSYDGSSPIVGFDMGGTSTDVSRYGGTFEHVFETTTAGVSIQSPQLDINTVAAGGGSMLFWRDGLFKVGPDSAGAHPGPASYRKGGPLTVSHTPLHITCFLSKDANYLFVFHITDGSLFASIALKRWLLIATFL